MVTGEPPVTDLFDVRSKTALVTGGWRGDGFMTCAVIPLDGDVTGRG